MNSDGYFFFFQLLLDIELNGRTDLVDIWHNFPFLILYKIDRKIFVLVIIIN